MKKFLSLLLAAVMAVCLLTACTAPSGQAEPEATDAPEAAALFKAGTYTGTGKGNNGDIVMEVTFSDAAITAIDAVSHGETAGLSDPAFANIPSAILAGQTLAVDTVSGATNSSRGILEAITSCVEQAGADPAALQTPAAAEEETLKDASCDIVVVGGGVAGMTAAITASKAGKQVILIDKLGTLGSGDSARISSYFRAGGSKLQQELGVEKTSAQDYYDKIHSESPNIPSEVLEILSKEVGPAADWLMELGVNFGKVSKSDPLRINMADGSAPGPEMVKALWGELDRLGVEYRLDTRATDILMENGTAVGVSVTHGEQSYNIRARAVIMASGGYANNPDLIGRYAPEWMTQPSTGSPALTGDGQLMAERAGAKLISMDIIKKNPVCLETPDGNFSLIGVLSYSILVNHGGNRFINEDLSSTIVKAEAVMQQEGKEAYIIFDQQALDDTANVRKYNDRGYFMKADTMEELAGLIDVDKDALLATFAKYQETFDAGIEDEFGRTLSYRLDKAPYYVCRVTASLQNTSGGMAVDPYGRALNAEDQVIPGLYGAGHGVAHCGEGNTLDAGMASLAVVYGKVSAETAAADIG